MTNLPVPSPGQAITGVDMTAAFFNANVRDSVNFLTNPPILKASDPNASTITMTTSGTPYQIHLPTVGIDSYSGWNASTWTYVCQAAGWYQVGGGVSIKVADNVADYLVANVTVNGTAIADTTSEFFYPGGIVGDLCQMPLRSTSIFLSVGDTVQLWATAGAASTHTWNTSTLDLRWVHS